MKRKIRRPLTRHEKKEDTREALIAAATMELAEKGIEAASLNAICDRAGFTRGAFYFHFKDRDDLVAAVVERLIGGFQNEVIATDSNEDLTTTIGRYVSAVIGGSPTTVGTNKWQFHHTLAACWGSPKIRARYLALQKRAVERITTAAVKGQQARTVRDDVPAQALAEILLVLTLGIAAALEIKMPVDLGTGGAALVKLVSRGAS
jgi:TetR/AcrR family transcriptional regulator, transcriptional repressor for nem operon